MGIRKGIPHVNTMAPDELWSLIHNGTIHITDVTEKTDGMCHAMGYDGRFYTQSSGSGSQRMYNSHDYFLRASARSEKTGKPLSRAWRAFSEIHNILASNKILQDYLKNGYSVTGEIFYKPFGNPSDVEGEIKFVGTSYDPSHMGEVGKYIIHSKMEGNEHMVESERFSDDLINFDTDSLIIPSLNIDVDDEKNTLMLMGLNDKEAVQSISNKVDNAIKSLSLTPKWGSGSEGIVVHPVGKQPRFKVTSDTFREYRKTAHGW